jgi:hypothetical protein
MTAAAKLLAAAMELSEPMPETPDDGEVVPIDSMKLAYEALQASRHVF